jgi:hypothetical protein
MVGAVSAALLTGPWIVALVKGVSVPLAVDTFCPENLISLQLGGEMTPTSGNILELGDAPLGVVGKTVLPVQLGSVLKDCTFQVLGTMEPTFAFLGWKEQQALGIDISNSGQVIGLQGQELPFTCSFSKAQGYATAVRSDAPSKMIEFTVKLAATVVVPSGAHMIALGDVVAADIPTEGYLKIDPMVLTKRYGTLLPRAFVPAGRQVPVVIRNPLPEDVKLFRCSEIGTACFAEVDDSQAAEMRPGRLCDPSSDIHPVDALELGHLSAS